MMSSDQLEETTMSSSLTPSWLDVRPQLPDRLLSVKWLAEWGTAAGEVGACARPGFFGGMGGGWPLSALGMVGDLTPCGSTPAALLMMGDSGAARLR